MSIAQHIASLKDKALWPYAPAGLVLKRRLYLSETAMKDLQDPNSAMNLLGGRGYVQAAMTHWVAGGLVRADEKGRARFLKRLRHPPPEIWELRVTDPIPQFRLFGRVVEPDTLVLTKFHTRQLLGDRKKKGNQWQVEMDACAGVLDKLFPGFPLVQENDIRHYVTENCDAYRL